MADRIPPQNLEAEEAVLGAILIKAEVFADVSAIINSEDFYRQDNRIIFSVMQKLFDDSKPIDIVTVIEQLNRNKELEKVGGVTYISRLGESLSTAANAKYYARIVREKSDLRRLIDAAAVISGKAYEQAEDAVDIMDEAEKAILEVASGRNRTEFTHVRTATNEAIEKISKLMEAQGELTGLATNFHLLDAMTSGLQASDLILIAARPSMGKTAFVLNIAANVAENGYKVAFFSLEMSKVQLVLRLLSSDSAVEAQRIRTGDVTDEEWLRVTNSASRISEKEIFIDDTPSISVMELRSKARRLKAETGLDLIIIDYLQLMQGRVRSNGENRQQEISDISRSLKALARELDVPVIALSQLSRGVEARQVKKPMLSDLRESGSLEQDADIVMFLYREDYYEQETEKQGLTDLIIAKHRNGAVGTIQIGFTKEYTRFTNIEFKNQ